MWMLCAQSRRPWHRVRGVHRTLAMMICFGIWGGQAVEQPLDDELDVVGLPNHSSTTYSRTPTASPSSSFLCNAMIAENERKIKEYRVKGRHEMHPIG
ncbi:hypothetical protein GGR50DRAFT_657706 [Xylaria sp. CBS 124048]|nr:hypothetical protein GGR50DRAFT_657706 [Xylaria sp. CBS 124048]